MTGPSDTYGKATPVLVTAGTILRTLNPSTVASLLFLDESTNYTQQEIAEEIGSSRSSVSQYQRSLEDLTVPLAAKQGYRYRITSAGETIVAYLDGMADRLNVDLHSLDWQSEDAHDQVATLLTPLYDSRSTRPFLILHSAGSRSAVGDQIDRLNPPQPIWIDEIIRDVEDRQQERGETSTPAQIRQTVRRFEDKGVFEINDNQITLTEKGREHAALLERVTQLVEDEVSSSRSDINESDTENSTDRGDRDSVEETHSPKRVETIESSDASGLPVSEEARRLRSDEEDNSGDFIQQSQPHGFLAERPSVGNEETVSKPPAIVPVYCLRTDAVEERDSSSPSYEQLLPVLPFTTLSVEGLIDQARQLGREHDMTAELEPYWMMRIGSDYYHIEPSNNPTVDLPDSTNHDE